MTVFSSLWVRIVLFVLVIGGIALPACSGTETRASAGTPAVAAAAAPERSDAAGASPSAPAATRAAAREVTIPAGTHLPIVLDTTVGSDISRVEEPVSAHLAKPLVVHGQTLLPAGSRVAGVVTDATRSARVKGRAHIAVRFDSMSPNGEDTRYRIHTTAVGRTAPGTKKKDALEIGAPAAGGAIIGALIGGKKGALIGTAAGGGAGTAIVLSTRGKEVHLNRGARLTLRLVEPVTVKIRG